MFDVLKMRHHKIIGLVALIVALVILAFTVDVGQLTDRKALQKDVNEDLFMAALSFVGMFTLLRMIFVPFVPVSALAGYLFGWKLGSVLAVVVMVLSSVVIFVLSRFLGKNWTRTILEDRFELVKKYDTRLGRHGLFWVMFFRIVPVMNHTALNFMFGASRVRTGDFLIGTVLGVLPGSFILANIGASVTDVPRLIVFAILFVALVGTSLYLKRKL